MLAGAGRKVQLRLTKRAVRLGRMAILASALLAGCTPTPREYATQVGQETDQDAATFSACLKEIRSRPQYAPLLAHVSDLDTGPTMAQLTDEATPSGDDARLLAARFDATNTCRTKFMTDLSTVRPDLVIILAPAFTKREDVVVLLVERKITWADAARRTRTIAQDMQQRIALANRVWISDLAAHRPDSAQRQAAALALMRWSSQQQVFDAVNSR